MEVLLLRISNQRFLSYMVLVAVVILAWSLTDATNIFLLIGLCSYSSIGVLSVDLSKSKVKMINY